MTGNRVLTKAKIAADSGPVEDINGVGYALPGKTPAVGTIAKLQDVVARLQEVEKLNNNLQGQYMQGSAAWESCEKIDDQLHEVFTLLGE